MKFCSRRIVLALPLLAAFSVTPALAAGSFKLKSHDVQEVGGKWHVYVTIELPKAPTVPHVPMRFVFSKVAVFSRILTDSSPTPTMVREVKSEPLPKIESMDVNFGNIGGKTFKGTSFDFDLSRKNEYVAGEYKVQVRLADGTDIGGSATLTLRGDNEVEDRRSMVFDAKKKGVEKVDNGTGQNASDLLRKNDYSNYQPPSQEVTPAGSAAPFIPASAYERTAEEDVKVKPGGCGCETMGTESSTSRFGLGALAILGVLPLLRRRRA